MNRIVYVAMIFFAIIIIVMLYFGTEIVRANENQQSVTSVNNNYLGMGTPGALQKSEARINGQIGAMPTPTVIPNEYNNIVYTDHNWNPEILEYLLESNGLKAFRIKENPIWFVQKTTNSKIGILKEMPHEQELVYVFS